MAGSHSWQRRARPARAARPVLLHITDSEFFNAIAGYCTRCGVDVRRFSNDEMPVPSVAIVECSALDPDPLLPIEFVRRRFTAVPIVVVARHSSEQLVLSALRSGVRDYLRWPLDLDEFRRALACEEAAASGLDDPAGLVGTSQSLSPVVDAIRRLGATDTTVLVTGETGTGKELVAQALHRNGIRRDRAFVSVNCAAIPDTLIESELFGYERGAFTGANAARAGKLHLAHRGTLFLDEVGDLSLQAQAKMLRAIETREVLPLGGTKEVAVDVRIIAATNKDLLALSVSGAFRSDLLFRLNVVEVRLPPLRERQADILLLAEHFIRHFNGKLGFRVEGLGDAAAAALQRYRWPGNIRELRNAIEAACLNANGPVLNVHDFPPQIVQAPDVGDDERTKLCEALLETRWNLSKAAERLQWSRTTVYRKIARYNLFRPQH